MKKLFFKSLLVFVAVFGCLFGYYGYSKNLSLQTGNYVPGEVIVKYKSSDLNMKNGVSALGANNVRSFSKSLSEQNFTIESVMPQENIMVLSINDDKSVEESIAILEKDKNIEYAEPNYLYYEYTIDTNDTYTGNLWGLHNYGQSVSGIISTSGEDIDWVEAWQTFSGSFSSSATGVLVGIIDAGVNYNHEDLSGNMWNNGFDFVNNDDNPMASIGSHGTHIAGTIAALMNNSKGIVGVNPSAKIMSLKVGEEESFTLDHILGAIDYAINHGIKIINASWGGPEYSTGLYNKIAEFRDAGGLFVVAAGNDGRNNDSYPTYPCNYDLDNILCVTATTQTGGLAWFSNTGINSVDVGAPGTNIYSTVVDEDYNIFYRENFGKFSNLQDLYDLSWRTGGNGDLIFYSGVVIFFDMSASSGTYLESPEINIDSLDNNDLWINARVACKNSITDNDYLELQVDTGAGWQPVSEYGENTVTSDNYYTYYNVGQLSNSGFKYRFYFYDDINYTGFSCGIYEVNIKTYKDYQGLNNLYDFKDGTSMATPHVAGLVSLAWSFRPDLSYSGIIDAIVNNGDSLPALSGKTRYGKRINVYKTLYALDNYAPESPILVSPMDTERVKLDIPVQISFEWNASHDTGVGVSGYVFELSESNAFSELVTGIIISTTGLNFDIVNTGTYYWRVKAFDKKGNTGGLSSSYSVIIEGSLCYFNETIVNNGESITGYETEVVPYGGTCESQVRTCTNGILSGTYEYSGCVVQAPSPCIFNGVNVSHGTSITGYRTSTVPYGGICESQVRTCTNGILSGTYEYSGCVVQAPSSCAFNGVNVSHGTSITGYRTSTVPYGGTCESQVRTCTNGILSGTYEYSGCVVQAPSSCAFNGVNVSHGTSITGYRTSTVPYGGICESQVRTCTNGILSGTYEYSGCVVQANPNSGGGSAGGSMWFMPINSGGTNDTGYKSNIFDSIIDSLDLDSTKGEKKTQQELLKNGYTREFNDAYEFAYQNGITTMKSINQANMNGSLSRIAMAKMLSQYAINILGKIPDKTKKCNFGDVTKSMDEQYSNGVTLACQLGLMGVGIDKFRPNENVTRAQFGTALSRLLYGLADGKDKYYSTHLFKLKQEGIISNDSPVLKEVRGYVMIMLMRSAE